MAFQELRNELKSYYWHHADEQARRFCERCLPLMEEQWEEGMSLYAQKRLQYRVICEQMEPVVFSHSPFYYETGTLAAQCDGARDFRGHKSAAGWVYWRNQHHFKEADPALYALTKEQKKEKLYLVCGPYNDTTQHFVFNYLPVLKGGLKSVYQKAQAKKEGATAEERDFLHSVCEGLLCVKKISEGFAKVAEERLSRTASPEEALRLRRIALSARRCPWEAPRSFYEALNLLAFLRKVLGSLEGVGFSSFGRPDLDLAPFYEKDLREGVLTKEEAYGLIAQFLLTFDCHYDQDGLFEGYSEHELENTYVLGGCDEWGEPFCNDLTLMFLRATREEKLIYPKIKLRFSSRSPKEMLDEANRTLLMGRAVILYQNDEATIPALRAMGRTEKEARDYLVFGCWGMASRGNEKFDDGSYVNLLKTLELSVHRDVAVMERVGMHFAPLDGAQSFEEVYRRVCDNAEVLLKERARVICEGGRIWERVDTLPLFSSTLEGCLEKRRDSIRGGAKYWDDRNLLFGFPNLVDALSAIRRLCFEEKRVSLEEYLEAVRCNWEGREALRQAAVSCSGWGDGKEESSLLAKRLHEDLARMLAKLEGHRGGKIIMGFLTYTELRWWGEALRATPDGRKNGDYLSQGLTPSRLTKIPFLTDVVASLRCLDPSHNGGNSVVNLILPSKKMTLASCEAFLRGVAQSAAQALQLNCTCREELLDAQKHPERYPDLIVRVAGFSAKFTSLSPQWQEEVITRNFYE